MLGYFAKAVLTGAALAALSTTAAAQSKQIPLLTVAISSDLRSSNPGVNRDGNSDNILAHVVEGLVAYREDLTVGPMLAESWTIGEDGKTYSFKLRQGVTFHNGAPLTSAEAAWSWRRYLDAKTAWQCRRFFDGVQGPKVTAIETPDPSIITFALEKPSGIFLVNMANIPCNAAILHPSSVSAGGEWVAPIGTGPYRIGDWQRGRQIDLVRFDRYSALPGERDGLTGGKQAFAERVRFLVTPDASVMKAAIYAGNIDVNPSISPTEIEEAKQRGLQVQIEPTLSWRTMLVQTADPLLSDVRVRRAIAHAIDLKEVSETASFGMAKPNPAAVPLASPFRTAAFEAWPAYDPAAAKKLLKEAGYAGQPVVIQANMRPGGYHEIAIAFQAMLSEVGMNVRIDTLDWATQLQNYSTGKFQLSSFAFSPRLDPALGYSSVVGEKSASPTAQWDDAKARELLEESKATTDKARRQAIFEELHRRMAEAVPIYGLYNDVQITAVGAKVRGFKSWSTGIERYWGVWKE